MARYDIARFGSEVFRALPSQADLFIIAGTITAKCSCSTMLWDQIPGPNNSDRYGCLHYFWRPFMYDNYSVVRGANTLIPVDVFIPVAPLPRSFIPVFLTYVIKF
jgi:NADH:ubiquinone oxidoreductase subunit B-like Fe-S oxidoreductase